MKTMIDIKDEDLGHLMSAGCSRWVIDHCLAVARKALEIANSLKKSVDLEPIKDGALNHDIGRAKTQTILHAVAGAQIARDAGMDEKVVKIIERHIGAGIPAEETAALGLPFADYIPLTPEEVIVSYADNLLNGDKVMGFEESLGMMSKRLGEGHPGIERFVSMHALVRSWME